ncbi:hypothetical protein V8F06_013038 [Rhypophila decipiens]
MVSVTMDSHPAATGSAYTCDVLEIDDSDLSFSITEEYKIRAMDRGERDFRQEETHSHSRRERRVRRSRSQRLDPAIESIQRLFTLRGGREDWGFFPGVLLSSRLERSFINPQIVRKLGLGNECTARADPLDPTCLEGDRRQQKSEKKALEKLRDMIMMGLRDILVHAPLAFGATGAYIMGSRRSDPAEYEVLHRVAEGDGATGHTPDDTFLIPTISPPPLLVAIAITSFSLTAHHYILVQKHKDRDLLVVGFVGAGFVAGSLAGLDGISIVLRVAPWCAIAAFFLCAFVLPPRGRRLTGDGTQGAKELRDETILTAANEKEGVMDCSATGDSKLMHGLERKMQSTESHSLV